MKTKELITKLLDRPMDDEIHLYYPKEHPNEHGISSGYVFDIDNIEGNYITFTDWRDEK